MAIKMPVGRAIAAMAAAMLVFTSFATVISPAQAVTSQGETRNNSTTFYAYVNKGERLQLTTDGPSTTTSTLLNEKGATVGFTNGFSPTAGSDGVWRVTIAPQVSGKDGGFTYDLSVRAGTTEKKGRIWVYEDSIEQPKATDMSYFGVSDLGYVYKITLNESQAWTAKIALRSSGAAPDSKCNVENRSFDSANGIYLTAYLNCGDKYRLFFEDPRNSGLPDVAKMGNATVPVLPPMVNSSQLTSSTKVAFTPNSDEVGGSFIVTSHEAFSGTADLQIDANNNGSYTDTVDVVQTVVINSGTSLPWDWDGKNASGAKVATGAKARAVISKGGEAHLLLHDSESFGGLTMSRLNGDSPDSNIRWDDRSLVRPRGGAPKSAKTCLGGCNSNVTGGIHGWTQGATVPGYDYSTSWGDGSVIDNWSYASVNATSPVIALPALRTLTLDGTGGTIQGPTSIDRTNGFTWGSLPAATAAGKVFLGWFTAKTGGTQLVPGAVASGNVTAYAQWRPAKFNVVFYGNAQMGAVTGSTGSIAVDSGCTSCLLPVNGFSKATGAPEMIDHEKEQTEVNSKFLGWSLDPLSRIGDIADRAVAGSLSQTDGETVKLYAIWDDAPRFIITSYPDRYFNLKHAQTGVISETSLLKTVKASDKETNPLATKTKAQVQSSGNDVGITLFDYDAADFTSLKDYGVVTVTYKVKDEAANVAFLRIRVTVSDDAPLSKDATKYLRGISPEYADKGAGEGGLSAESLWQTDPTRKAALGRALSGDVATTYCLDAAAISELRTQIDQGLGNSETPAGLAASAAVLRESGICK